jgi:hypothetical protein
MRVLVLGGRYSGWTGAVSLNDDLRQRFLRKHNAVL